MLRLPKQAAFVLALGALGYAYIGASSSAISSLDSVKKWYCFLASSLAYGFASVPPNKLCLGLCYFRCYWICY